MRLHHLFGGPKDLASATAKSKQLDPATKRLDGLSTLIMHAKSEPSWASRPFIEILFRTKSAAGAVRHVLSYREAFSQANKIENILVDYRNSKRKQVDGQPKQRASSTDRQPKESDDSKEDHKNNDNFIVILELRVPLFIILCELALLSAGIVFCPINPDDQPKRKDALRNALVPALGLTEADRTSNFLPSGADMDSFTVTDTMVREWLTTDDDSSTSPVEEGLLSEAKYFSDDRVAYYVFTSGTTGGAPKAVKVLRKQIALYGKCFGARFIENPNCGQSEPKIGECKGKCEVEEEDNASNHRSHCGGPHNEEVWYPNRSVRVLYASAITFDPSIGDLLIAMSYGGAIICSGGTLADTDHTLRLVESNNRHQRKKFDDDNLPACIAEVPLSFVLRDCVAQWPATSSITADISFLAEHSMFTHLTSTPVVVSNISDAVRLGLQSRSAWMGEGAGRGDCRSAGAKCPRERGSDGLRPTVCLGGEPMQPSLAAKWAPAVDLYNIYGVTEAVIYQNATRITEKDCLGDNLSRLVRTLGAPLDAAACWCAIDFTVKLDDEDSNGEEGELGKRRRLGELILLGPMVAAGYQRPSTAFFTYEFSSSYSVHSTPAYRTGDVVSYDEDTSRTTFVGRRDFQVKIGGKRTSLEEVESLMKSVIVLGGGFSNTSGMPARSYYSALDPWLQTTRETDLRLAKEPLPLSVKACTVAAVPRKALEPGNQGTGAVAADGDDNVLVCYLCIETPLITPSPASVLLSSSVVRAIMTSSSSGGVLAAHMVPLYTVVEVIDTACTLISSTRGTERKPGGTQYMTPNGKTDRVGLKNYIIARVKKAREEGGAEVKNEGNDESISLVDTLTACSAPQSVLSSASTVSRARSIVEAVISTWETTLGVGLVLRPSTNFAESGGDSLQAARFMGRLARKAVTSGLLTNLGVDGLQALAGGKLPTGFEATLLLGGLPTSRLGGLCAHFCSLLSEEESDPIVNAGVPSDSPTSNTMEATATSARIALMAKATANCPHADLLLQCVAHREYFLADWLLSHEGLTLLKGRLETRGATATVLHTAARLGDERLCSLLMHHGAGVTDINAERSTPVFAAVESHQLGILKMFVERLPKGTDGTYRTGLEFVRDGRSQGLLHAAARSLPPEGSESKVLSFLLRELRLDPEVRDKWQRTPLHWAIINGNASAIDVILKFFEENGGVNVNKAEAKHGATRKPFDARTKAHWSRLALRGTSKEYQTPAELIAERNNAQHSAPPSKQDAFFRSDELMARIKALPFV